MVGNGVSDRASPLLLLLHYLLGWCLLPFLPSLFGSFAGKTNPPHATDNPILFCAQFCKSSFVLSSNRPVGCYDSRTMSCHGAVLWEPNRRTKNTSGISVWQKARIYFTCVTVLFQFWALERFLIAMNMGVSHPLLLILSSFRCQCAPTSWRGSATTATAPTATSMCPGRQKCARIFSKAIALWEKR